MDSEERHGCTVLEDLQDGGPAELPRDGQGTLKVTSATPGAQVFVDNVRVGEVPYTGPLAAGTYSVDDSSLQLTGEAADDNAGYSLAGGQDMDGDGLADLLIGAPGKYSTANPAGLAYLVEGLGY